MKLYLIIISQITPINGHLNCKKLDWVSTFIVKIYFHIYLENSVLIIWRKERERRMTVWTRLVRQIKTSFKLIFLCSLWGRPGHLCSSDGYFFSPSYICNIALLLAFCGQGCSGADSAFSHIIQCNTVLRNMKGQSCFDLVFYYLVELEVPVYSSSSLVWI